MASLSTGLPADVEPVTGDEAQEYQSVIVEGVRKELADEEALGMFVRMTRDYGKGLASPQDFWLYLTVTFGRDKGIAFLPKLARLIADDDKRQALLRAPFVEMEEAKQFTDVPLASAGSPAEAATKGPIEHEVKEGDFSDRQAAVEAAPSTGTQADSQADSAPADGQADLPPEVLRVREMFPDLPVPAIQAALQKASVQTVIEKALDGSLDRTATPALPSRRRKGARVSGHLVPVTQARMRFPPESVPSHMLPRDLARLQDLFPKLPTSLLQAELQVTGSVQFAMETLLTNQAHIEVLRVDPVPVALRGYLVKSDPGGRNFTRRFFILRQLTGSLCYARVPEDMDDPLGVVYLFNSRLSGASDSATTSMVKSKFPSISVEAGFCLVTPNRTYQLFAESVQEANAWKTVLREIQALMVPPEFEAGKDVVELEVFENERYGPLAGWGPNFWPGERLTYSNRKGELSSMEFPEVRLPRGFKWEDEWHIDSTYTETDADGWSYGTTFGKLESDLEHGTSNPENGFTDLCRRRRWLRTSRRVVETADDEVVVDFGGNTAVHDGGDVSDIQGGIALVGDEGAFGLKGKHTDAGL